MTWGRLSAGALLLAAAGGVVAHPHGRLDCQVQVQVQMQMQAQVQSAVPGLASIALQLTLDAASSAALVPRLQFDAQGQMLQDKPVRWFADLMAGMFRQSGWMLKLQALGADGAPVAQPLDLADPEPARFSRLPGGEVVVAVQLRPSAPAVSAHGWALACLDPTWYWATGFAGAPQFSASAPCRAELEPMRDMAAQARQLQDAAVRSGVPGADQAAPGLLTTAGVRAPSGTIRCPAP